MKRGIKSFISILVGLSVFVSAHNVAFSNSMNTAQDIAFGKTYTYTYTYDENDGDNGWSSDADHCYRFAAPSDGKCEILLTTNGSYTNELLENTYLELIDEKNTEVSSGLYIPAKQGFYLYYEDLEKGMTYFPRVTCFVNGTSLSITVYFKSEETKAEAKAKASNINKTKVSASDIKKASNLGATSITLGAKVKKIKPNAFRGTRIKTVTVKSTKLKAKTVKDSLKGSKVKTIKVKVGKKSLNKKYVKKYKKIFTKKNTGKKVTVK